MTDRLLTAREQADRLHVSAETVLRWRRQGKLPADTWCVLPSGQVRFFEDRIEDWLQERATPRRGVLTTTPGAARPQTVPSTVLTTTDDDEED